MNKMQTIHSFWSGFGLKAYNEASVPTGENKPEFPYITYQFVDDSFGNEVLMSASLWYKTTSWAEPYIKQNEISTYIDMGGKVLPCDEGAIWIKRGIPFAQNMSDNADQRIKRVLINITAEYITQN